MSYKPEFDKMADILSLKIKTFLEESCKTCCNCSNFNKKNDADVCELYNMKPPARVIVKGCNYHDWEIPF